MRDPFAPDFFETPVAPEPPAPVEPIQPVPSFPHRPARSMAAAMLAAGLVVGSVAGGAIGAILTSHRPAAANSSPSNVAGVSAPVPSPGSYAAIYQQTKDGVVTINTSSNGAGPRSFSQAEGSGIVVDNQGDILTNAHVVAGANQIRVTFSNRHDPDRRADQPREFRRGTARRPRPAHRHQRFDSEPGRGQCRHRLRHPHQPG